MAVTLRAVLFHVNVTIMRKCDKVILNATRILEYRREWPESIMEKSFKNE